MLRIGRATQEPPLVDNKSLGIVGIIYGVITAGVVMFAGALVHAHIDGRLPPDDGASYQAMPLPSPSLVRDFAKF